MAITFGIFAVLFAMGSAVDADKKSNAAGYELAAAVLFAVAAVAYGWLVK